MSATSARADLPATYEEYLLFEQSVDSRHEFIDGDILAMAGGTRRHAVLKSRLSTELTIGFGKRGPCHVEDSDTRVVVDRGERGLNAYYPDMVVLRDDGETHPRDREGGLINPTLLVEVTSRTSEKRDRGVKLDDYRVVPSLGEYVIVSHVRQELAVWSRDDLETPWTRRVFTAGDTAVLRGIAVSVSDLYRDPLPER